MKKDGDFQGFTARENVQMDEMLENLVLCALSLLIEFTAFPAKLFHDNWVNCRRDPWARAFTPTAPAKIKFQASACRQLP